MRWKQESARVRWTIYIWCWICVTNQCSTSNWRCRRRHRRHHRHCVQSKIDIYLRSNQYSMILSSWIWILKQDICRIFIDIIWSRAFGNERRNKHLNMEKLQKREKAWESKDGIEMLHQNNIRRMRFSDLLSKYISTCVCQCLSAFIFVYLSLV